MRLSPIFAFLGAEGGMGQAKKLCMQALSARLVTEVM